MISYNFVKEKTKTKEAIYMIHVGLDMHKRYSRLEVMDDSGKVLDKNILYHENKEEMRKYFSSIEKPATVTMEA